MVNMENSSVKYGPVCCCCIINICLYLISNSVLW